MEQTLTHRSGSANRFKVFAGGFLIVAAIIYLIASATQGNAQYFMTVDELSSQKEAAAGREVRVSGAVLGDTIHYDSKTLTLTFTVAHVPGDNKEIEEQGGLAAVLHTAVTDPSRSQMKVVYQGVKPDLLRNEAQAIMTGHMGEDGMFYAEELLLKCPTKYEQAVPDQAGDGA
jgi:cytochrome c-type biogenesis protein CcmE